MNTDSSKYTEPCNQMKWGRILVAKQHFPPQRHFVEDTEEMIHSSHVTHMKKIRPFFAYITVDDLKQSKDFFLFVLMLDIFLYNIIEH